LADLNRQSQRPRRALCFLHRIGHRYVAGNGQNGDSRKPRDGIVQKLELLGHDVWLHRAQPGNVTARAGEAGDKSGSDRIAARRHDDRDRAGRLLDGPGRLFALRHDDVHPELDEVGGETGE
jgi:hypothetical protein